MHKILSLKKQGRVMDKTDIVSAHFFSFRIYQQRFGYLTSQLHLFSHREIKIILHPWVIKQIFF